MDMLVDRHGHLQLEKEDDKLVDILLLDESGREELDGGLSEWSLVGTVFIEKRVNFLSFRDTMASVWRPGRGVSIKEICDKRYIFSFYHEIDMKRVIEYGPWLYDHNLVVLCELKLDDVPLKVPLFFFLDFWVQVHYLAVGHLNLGCFIKLDKNQVEGRWRAYLRIQVRLNISKPLKKNLKVQKMNEDCL
ncbi:unnamed protein product [Cuscuta epithymum]|uniref:DUF4283 domain-containing protein n=1 Tax=Cuscuta epithymum TaxID=186058 RepID=A0AAV0GJ36_9ASTE|nr:unnamed protein product [Cuscuta epithymum]